MCGFGCFFCVLLTLIGMIIITYWHKSKFDPQVDEDAVVPFIEDRKTSTEKLSVRKINTLFEEMVEL